MTAADTHHDRQASLKKLGSTLLRSNSLIFTYLRSMVSSQIAGWTDMLIGFLLFSFAGVDPVPATMAGAFCGGVINCIINYRFTFRADGVDWRAVIVKYAFVWTGSMLLNSFGTDAVYKLLSSWTWLEQIGFRPDGYYAAARLFTALMVSWFWNFVLQRYFVYRDVWADRYCVAFMKGLGVRRKDDNKEK